MKVSESYLDVEISYVVGVDGVRETKPIAAAKLGLVLARASSAVATFIERSLGQRGFCLTDFLILEALLHKGPLTISAIGEKVLLASASMTSAIDRLEERGLVQRSLSSEDRRVRLVGLTCEGNRFISGIYGQHVEDLERVFHELTEEERRHMYSGLKKIGLAAKASTPPLHPWKVSEPAGLNQETDSEERK